MSGITREAYEQGRVRRRDGGEFRIYAWPDETPDGWMYGCFSDPESTDTWCACAWTPQGRYCDTEKVLDLILVPRKRTAWVNVYSGSDLACVYRNQREAERDADNTVNKCLARAHPIEIED